MLRLLNDKDYNKGYIELLSQLTYTGSITQKEFNDKFSEISKLFPLIQIWVIEKDNIIIASGTLIIEPKFIHKCSNVGHIEDLVVHRNYRNQGYAREILKKLMEISKDFKCYKVILDCKAELKEFYEKLKFEELVNKNISPAIGSEEANFEYKNIQMSFYF